jgi:hypothetical protein
MSGWYALTVLNTVFVLILMRQVWQLTSLQRDHNEIAARDRDHYERMTSHETRNRRQEIQRLRDELIASRALQTRIYPGGDQILSELLKDVGAPSPKENPQERPLTSFERVLKDDPEDPPEDPV